MLKMYVVLVRVLKISQNKENTENLSPHKLVGKDIKMNSVDCLKMQCYYELDGVAGTGESLIDKAETLLSRSLREDKHIHCNYQNG